MEKHYKLRITNSRGNVSFVYATDANLKELTDKYEADDAVRRVEVFETKKESVESARKMREEMNALAIGHGLKTMPTNLQEISNEDTGISSNMEGPDRSNFSPAKSPYFSAPYNINQIDLKDKVQIQNFALHILQDPAYTLFPHPSQCDHETAVAATEFFLAQYNSYMEQAKKQNRQLRMKEVDTIRNEGATVKAKQRKVLEQKLTKSTNASEAEKNGKAASKLGQTPKHKKLLQMVSILGLNIPNFTTMSEEELAKAVKDATVGDK